ncbi:MAG: type I restriction enzyme HsdR N-terminal domain-containing protein [Bacteroidia bacterium]
MADKILPELIFPEYPFKLRISESQRTEIFDVFRKKYVILTPEEWVRQHVLSYLVHELQYPASLIAVEVSLNNSLRKQRADAVVYGSNLNPLLIVECKSSDVKLSNETFMQAARYNLELKLPFLIITNGLKLFAAKVSFINNEIETLNELPTYDELINQI